MPNRLLIPNTCQIPNILLDEVMAKVSHAEFKVIMAIARKTYGWNKLSDRISLSQLTGITHVSKQKVVDSIKNLSWVVLTHKLPNNNTEYSINIDAETGLLSGQGCPVSGQVEQQAGCLVSGQGCPVSGQVASLVSGHTKPTLKPTTKTHSTKTAGKGKKVKKPGDPRIKEFILWWCHRYQQLLKDEYLVKWAIEAAIVKTLLHARSLEEIKKRAEGLLATKDNWLRQHRTIPMLLSKWNDLGQTGPREEGPGPDLPVL